MSQRIVTGGAGFLGSHLTESLATDQHAVIAIDNFSTGRRQNIPTEFNQVSVIEHDIRDILSIDGPVDTIYHFASRASPDDFQDHALDIIETNTSGTINVLELARLKDASVVLASTSEIYGDPEVHPQPESYCGSTDPRGPRAPYNESKRLLETLGTVFSRNYGLDVRTVRIFNTYGPRLRPDDGRVISTFVTQAVNGDAITVHGDGEQTRSFCYVDDLIRGIRLAAEDNGLSGEVLNLGATDEISIKELASIVIELTGSCSPIIFTDRPTDDPEIRRPDISRAKQHLNWAPTVSLRDGLTRTIDYFKRIERVDRI